MPGNNLLGKQSTIELCPLLLGLFLLCAEYTCVREHAQMCVRKQEGSLGVLSHAPSTLFPETSLTSLDSPGKTRLVDWQAPGLHCLHPCPGLTSMHHHTQPFQVGSGDQTRVLSLHGRYFVTVHLPALPFFSVVTHQCCRHWEEPREMEELKVPSSRT